MGCIARAKQSLSLGLSVVLVFTLGPGVDTGMAYQTTTPAPAGSTASGYTGQGVPATAAELQALVAPIALYPDALVAQILAAATFPDQVAVASYWVQQNKTLTGSALVTAVDKQTWDPSVKALTAFPSVLNNMSQNLSWTSQLGEDYHNQQADVMTAVQTLRAQAKAAGNLKSGSQITVVQQSPQTIVIQPTNPQIVYVPVYNPAVIYGTPYVVPSYTTADVVAAGVMTFGLGLAIGAMMSSSWDTAVGVATGTVAELIITARPTTGTTPGMAATTAPVGAPMEHTAARTTARAITPQRGHTHAAHRLPQLTARKR